MKISSDIWVVRQITFRIKILGCGGLVELNHDIPCPFSLGSAMAILSVPWLAETSVGGKF